MPPALVNAVATLVCSQCPEPFPLQRLKDQRVTFPASLPASAGHVTQFWPVRPKGVLSLFQGEKQERPFSPAASPLSPCTSNVGCPGERAVSEAAAATWHHDGTSPQMKGHLLRKEEGRMEECGRWMTL